MHAPSSPAISVVVLGYRNETTIVAAVASLMGQRSADPFEVVVVTSGGDGSAAAVRTAFPEVTVIDVEARLLPGGARNRGVEVARGAIMAFLAADCLATPGWIDAQLAAHRSGHEAVASAISTAPPDTVFARAHTYDLCCSRLPGRPAGLVPAGDPAAHGISFDRATLDRAGACPEDLRIGEDSEMTRRLRDLGVPIWFEPRIVTAHHGPRTLRELLTDRHARGFRSGRAAPGPRPSVGAVLRAFPGAWWVRLRWVLRTGWRHARGERTRYAVALPWLVIGHTAGEVGRARGRLAGPAPTAGVAAEEPGRQA